MGALHNLQRQRMAEKNVDNWTWWNVNFKNCSPPSHRKPHAKNCRLKNIKIWFLCNQSGDIKCSPSNPIQSKKKTKRKWIAKFSAMNHWKLQKKPKANNVLFIWTKQNNITRKNALKKPDWIELHSFFADYFFGSVQKINSHYLLGLFFVVVGRFCFFPWSIGVLLLQWLLIFLYIFYSDCIDAVFIRRHVHRAMATSIETDRNK